MREVLVDKRVTDCFQMARTRVTGRSQWRAQGFRILLVVEGTCTIATKHERISLARFDRILVPYGLGELEIIADETVVFLECCPPQ
jgi:mannose-6-phosphate isomerase class I